MQTDPRKPPVHPAVVLLIGIASVSTASIFIRYAQQEAHSLVIAAYRLTIASLVLAPVAFRRHRAEIAGLSRHDWLLAAASGLFLAIHFATWISSLDYTSVVSSLVIVQTSPIWVALAAPIFLGEKSRPAVYWGLALAVLGGLVVSFGEACALDGLRMACPEAGELFSGRTAFGNFLALAGAWGAAGYLIIGRRLRAGMSLIAYIAVVYAFAAVILIGILLVSGHPVFGYPPITYLWLVLLALIPQLLGHSSFNWALGYLPASFVAVTLLGEPIGSTILAALLLEEVPSMVKLTGAAIILIGISVAATTRNQRPGNLPGESQDAS